MREVFLQEGLGYDAAIVSMDLALLLWAGAGAAWKKAAMIA
jgi:hypothetical protein